MIKDHVLCALEEQKGNIVTGGQLAASLGVSRTAIWKAIRTLQEEGNEIISMPNSGYRLMHTNDTLLESSIRSLLTTTFVGQSMSILPSVPSTNQHLKEIDAEALPSGYVLIADQQTNGRGRRGRTFLSPKREGIYLSVLLKLGGLQNDVRMITVYTAVAVSKAIEMVCGVRAEIKWVNDIYCNGKKICGILTEAVLSAELQELSTVIVGIGINTGLVPPEISDIATSVQEVTAQRGIRNRLIAEVLNQFEAVCLDLIEHRNHRAILSYYQSRLFMLGRPIIVNSINDSYPATATGIDETGALIVKDGDGNTHVITSGEVKLNWGNNE